MPHFTQSEVLFIREGIQDSVAIAQKLGRWIGQCHDPQVQSILSQHQNRFQQTANELINRLEQGPAAPDTGRQPQFGSGMSGMAGGSGQTQRQNWQQSATAAGMGSPDHIALQDCLKDCKYMAISATKAAEECSSPNLRQMFHRLCGEHLAMAETMYQIMDQRGWYIDPKAQDSEVQQIAQNMRSFLSQTTNQQQPVTQPSY